MMNYYILPIQTKPSKINLKYLLLISIVIAVLEGAQRRQVAYQVARALKIIESFGSTIFEITSYFIYFCAVMLQHLFSSSRQNNLQKENSNIVIRPNYANIFGGATILMITKSCYGKSNILSEDIDKYMHTFTTTPIEFVIGLKQEIAIQSISIKSRQMYSSIVKHFKVEGSFTFPDANWTELGSFKAANTFKQQEFIVNKKVLRYVKITINSVYGGWSYFTLTQISVFGQSLFAHAVKNTAQNNEPNNQSSIKSSENNTSIIDDTKQDICSSDPVKILSSNYTPEIMQNNVIVNLHQKIKTLEQNSKNMEKAFNDVIQKYQKLQKKLDKILEATLIEEQDETNGGNKTIQRIQKQEKTFWQFKDVIFEASGIFLICIVCTVFVIHLYNYVGSPQNINRQIQNTTEEPRSIIRRAISKARTMKIQAKSQKYIRVQANENKQASEKSSPKVISKKSNRASIEKVGHK